MLFRSWSDLLQQLILDFEGYQYKKGRTHQIAFQSAVRAVEFCNELHVRLTQASWPASLLCIEEFAEVVNPDTGDLLYRGIKLKASVHVGEPKCELSMSSSRTVYSGEVIEKLSQSHHTFGLPGATLLTVEALNYIKNQAIIDREAFILLEGCEITPASLTTNLGDMSSHPYLILPRELAKRFVEEMKNRTIQYYGGQDNIESPRPSDEVQEHPGGNEIV